MPARKQRKPPAFDLDLHDFSAVGNRLHAAAGVSYGAQASLCLRNGRPKGKLSMRVQHDGNQTTLSVRAQNITQSIRATYADLQDATEHGAYGIALLLSAKQFGYQLLQRSFKGTGFDYFLLPPDVATFDPNDIYATACALEVSGILEGGDREISRRRAEKLLQVRRHRTPTALVAVVEFSRPIAHIEQL